MADVVVRDANEADLARIHAIYDHAVLTTTATWDEEPWPWERRLDWWREHCEDSTTPVIVAETGHGEIAGFAYLSWYRRKSGYRFTRENTVYVDPGFHRRGIGRLLMTALLERARAAGIHSLVACIDGSNDASIALHREFGYVIVGHDRELGFKFGRWLDSVTMQLLIKAGDNRR